MNRPPLSDHVNQLFIDAGWLNPDARMPTHVVVDPTTEQPVVELGQASPRQARAAIEAARRAFDAGLWSGLSPKQRAEYLHAIGDQLASRCEELAQNSLAELGQPLFATRDAMQKAIDIWHRYADLAVTYRWTDDRSVDARRKARVMREPVGVVLAITPWNAPLMLASLKLAPALAAGCSVVLKPASECPLTLPFLAEAAEAVGLPAGVLNLVYAEPTVSAAMVTDRDVDLVSFTGSSAVGSEIMRSCADNITRVALELGGKSAAIVLADADPATVTPSLLASAGFALAGQVCTSRARILVQRSRHEEWVNALVEGLAAQRIGDPADPDTTMGPLATKRQRQRVEEYIKVGREEGARLVYGGVRPAHLPRGWFIEPTLFDNVTTDMRIAQEEIFGPVLSVLTYDDEDEAVRIANDSQYGLAGSVWTQDVAAGYRIARRVRTGTFQVNTAGHAFDQPAGGVKKSGIGREGGVEGLEQFFEIRQIQLPVDAVFPDEPVR